MTFRKEQTDDIYVSFLENIWSLKKLLSDTRKKMCAQLQKNVFNDFKIALMRFKLRGKLFSNEKFILPSKNIRVQPNKAKKCLILILSFSLD